MARGRPSHLAKRGLAKSRARTRPNLLSVQNAPPRHPLHRRFSPRGGGWPSPAASRPKPTTPVKLEQLRLLPLSEPCPNPPPPKDLRRPGFTVPPACRRAPAQDLLHPRRLPPHRMSHEEDHDHDLSPQPCPSPTRQPRRGGRPTDGRPPRPGDRGRSRRGGGPGRCWSDGGATRPTSRLTSPPRSGRPRPTRPTLSSSTPGARQAHAWAVARRLRADPAEPAPFLIVLADHRRDIDRQAAGRVGVDLYLAKPADTDLLEGVLRRFARIIRPAEVVPADEPGRSRWRDHGRRNRD